MEDETSRNRINPASWVAFGDINHVYDANGNMLLRGGSSANQTLTWDVENRPISVSDNSTVLATFVYDGDGNRVIKTEGGETIIYVNQHYEVNVTSSTATSNYYLGGKLIAVKEGTEIRYIHQDHLGSTSFMTDAAGQLVDTTVVYEAYGEITDGRVPTDRLFTGQRLDQTGLYFYNARYYDATIGRFISADSEVPNPINPQSLNRFSYCFNNPLRYLDPSGHDPEDNPYYYLDWAWRASLIQSGKEVPSVVVSSQVNERYNSADDIMTGTVSIDVTAMWKFNENTWEYDEVTIETSVVIYPDTPGKLGRTTPGGGLTLGAAKVERDHGPDYYVPLESARFNFPVITRAGYLRVTGHTTIYDVAPTDIVNLSIGLACFNPGRMEDETSRKRINPASWVINLRNAHLTKNIWLVR